MNQSLPCGTRDLRKGLLFSTFIFLFFLEFINLVVEKTVTRLFYYLLLLDNRKTFWRPYEFQHKIGYLMMLEVLFLFILLSNFSLSNFSL